MFKRLAFGSRWGQDKRKSRLALGAAPRQSEPVRIGLRSSSKLDGERAAGARLQAVCRRSPSLASRSDGNLWDHTGKAPVFRTERLLSELPTICPGSVSIVFCWQLLDLLPREALADVVRRMYLYLEPSGVLFFVLREACLTTGADTIWCLETLTKLATQATGQKPFPYPPLSNREMERLIPTGIVKTVLTRSGLREVLAVRPSPTVR